MLNKVNAEARSLSIEANPKFGLMVNRPIHWKKRNYYANIVSLQDSISWNSDCSTVINVNQIRGWNGQVDEHGNMIHKHFGDSDRPFDLARFLQQAFANQNNNNQQGNNE